MFRITPNGKNRIDIELKGGLNRDEMKDGLDELIKGSRHFEHGRMLYRIEDFAFPSLGAMAIEFSRLPELFGLVTKFDRVAVLAEKEWIQKASEIEGALIPGLDIKAFDLEEVAAAEAWLASDPN